MFCFLQQSYLYHILISGSMQGKRKVLLCSMLTEVKISFDICMFKVKLFTEMFAKIVAFVISHGHIKSFKLNPLNKVCHADMGVSDVLLRTKISFFNLHDVTKAVGRAKIP